LGASVRRGHGWPPCCPALPRNISGCTSPPTLAPCPAMQVRAWCHRMALTRITCQQRRESIRLHASSASMPGPTFRIRSICGGDRTRGNETRLMSPLDASGFRPPWSIRSLAINGQSGRPRLLPRGLGAGSPLRLWTIAMLGSLRANVLEGTHLKVDVVSDQGATLAPLVTSGIGLVRK